MTEDTKYRNVGDNPIANKDLPVVIVEIERLEKRLETLNKTRNGIIQKIEKLNELLI